MADKKISALPAATTPLAGTEVLPIVQGGVTDQVSVANLTSGRDVTVKKLNATDNIVIGTAGKGIDFSANAHAPGMTSELLDWYEEGTWTPSVGGDATYTVQDGRYTRIGRIVIVQAKIQINVLGTGSVTTVSGLPYAASVTPFATTGSGSVSYFGSLATSVTTLVAFVNSGSSTVLFSSLGAAATTMSAVTNVFGNGTRIDFSVAYEV